MKKTNVMIEVSDSLYDSIVQPYKKRKEFGKLVVQLLEAYSSNDKIYGYINGVMDGIAEEENKELLKDLQNMAQSLNMMGILQDQVESYTDEGLNYFSEKSNSENNDIKPPVSDFDKAKDEKALTRDDVIEIVNESMSDVKSMLSQVVSMISNGVSVNESNSKPEMLSVEENIGYVESNKSDSSDLIISEFNDQDDVDEDDGVAYNALQELLGSLM